MQRVFGRPGCMKKRSAGSSPTKRISESSMRLPRRFEHLPQSGSIKRFRNMGIPPPLPWGLLWMNCCKSTPSESGEKILLTAFGSGFTWGARRTEGRMRRKSHFLFPGQGAQYPGMGKDFSETFAVARETFEEADDTFRQKISPRLFLKALKRFLQRRKIARSRFLSPAWRFSE